MNRIYTTSELISINARQNEMLSTIKYLLKTAPEGKDLSLLRKMLWFLYQTTKNTRDTLDKRYLSMISNEQLHKDIQRTAV
jgi:hypothetical protein